MPTFLERHGKKIIALTIATLALTSCSPSVAETAQTFIVGQLPTPVTNFNVDECKKLNDPHKDPSVEAKAGLCWLEQILGTSINIKEKSFNYIEELAMRPQTGIDGKKIYSSIKQWYYPDATNNTSYFIKQNAQDKLGAMIKYYAQFKNTKNCLTLADLQNWAKTSQPQPEPCQIDFAQNSDNIVGFLLEPDLIYGNIVAWDWTPTYKIPVVIYLGPLQK
jgi:hypothetical protein